MTGARVSSRLLRARDVADLTLARAYPSISLLMPTRPGARMDRDDARILTDLADRVVEQLAQSGVLARGRVVDLLRASVREAVRGRTDRGLAVFVSLAVQRVLTLPLPVAPRGLVEATFATRDLVRVMHRVPPHLLLVVHPTCAQLYHAHGGSLLPLRTVELRLDRLVDADDDSGFDAFLEQLDNALGAGRRDQPGPLVVAGTPAVLDRLAATSTHLQRLAGRLIPEQCDHPRTLVRQAEIAVERYLGRRRDQALEQLAEARLHRPDSVHTGIEACWEAANAGRPALLVVEEGYAVPGTSSGVDEIARRPGDGAVYDRVDDLIEVVISRNGLLAFVEDDALHDLDRVSLVTRSGRVEERGDVPAWPNRP